MSCGCDYDNSYKGYLHMPMRVEEVWLCMNHFCGKGGGDLLIIFFSCIIDFLSSGIGGIDGQQW